MGVEDGTQTQTDGTLIDSFGFSKDVKEVEIDTSFNYLVVN